MHYYMPVALVPGLAPKLDDVKNLEVHLPSLVDIGNLLATVLLDIIQSYKASAGGWPEYNVGQFGAPAVRLKMYKIKLKTHLSQVVDYADKAVKYIDDFWSREDCLETAKCKLKKEIHEGLISSHTANQYTCDCAFNKYIPNDRCERGGNIRWDGKSPSSYKKITTSAYSTPYASTAFYSYLKWGLRDQSRVAKNSRSSLVKAFWKAQASDIIATLSDVIDVYGEDGDAPMELEYLDESRERILSAVARKMADDYTENWNNEMGTPLAIKATSEAKDELDLDDEQLREAKKLYEAIKKRDTDEIAEDQKVRGHWVYVPDENDIPMDNDLSMKI